MKCPNCLNSARWCDNKEIYGKSYGRSSMCWYCKRCDYYVGCHNNSQRPLGKMASRETRELRMACHKKFDTYWKENFTTRNEGYKWLQEIMKKLPADAHIGMFEKEECEELLTLI